MPVVIRQLTPVNVGQPGYAVAKELARQCADQYHLNILPGPGGGIAAGTCWAALAVAAGGPFPNLAPVNSAGAAVAGGGVQVGAGGLGYGISFGASQMARINAQVALPGFGGGGHAERVAINNASAVGQGLYLLAGNNAVMFVQLHPCNGPGTPDCQTWLGAVGTHAYSPQLNAIGPGAVTLNVYYRFAYPGGYAAMTAWNNTTRAAKQADITTW